MVIRYKMFHTFVASGSHGKLAISAAPKQQVAEIYPGIREKKIEPKVMEVCFFMVFPDFLVVVQICSNGFPKFILGWTFQVKRRFHFPVCISETWSLLTAATETGDGTGTIRPKLWDLVGTSPRGLSSVREVISGFVVHDLGAFWSLNHDYQTMLVVFMLHVYKNKLYIHIYIYIVHLQVVKKRIQVHWPLNKLSSPCFLESWRSFKTSNL